MSKKTTKTSVRDAEKAARVKKVAELTGLSTSSIYKVIQGERMNESILELYIRLEEREALMLQEEKNRLLDSVNNLVPFDK